MGNFAEIRTLFGIAENEGFEEEEIAGWEQQLGVRLPERLRAYYLTLGKHEALNYAHNRLLTGEEIDFSDDDYLVFYEENQVVAYWGTKREDLKNDNPPVYGNYDPDWHLENSTMEGFLLLQAVYNGVLGGLTYNANSLGTVDPEVVAYVTANWQVVAEISSPVQQVYTKDFTAVVSLSFDKANTCTGAFAGTNNADLFDEMMTQLEIDWDYISTEDGEEV